MEVVASSILEEKPKSGVKMMSRMDIIASAKIGGCPWRISRIISTISAMSPNIFVIMYGKSYEVVRAALSAALTTS